MKLTLEQYHSMIKTRSIGLIGVGVSHRELIRQYAAAGARLTVRDRRSLSELGDFGQELQQMGVRLMLGADYLSDISEEILFRTPGMKYYTPELTEARRRGVAVTSELELFLALCPCPVYGITGSDGKTTSTTLIAELLRRSGRTVHLGGNIGAPLLPIIDQVKPEDAAVVELSSFQLETTSSLQAVAATILNVTEDHMDRYPLGLQQYRAAKLRIYENAKTCVVNADDALTMPVRGADDRCISFGVDVGDYHLNRQQGETWLRVKGEKVLNVKEMPLTGQHNYSNALAALALADAAGLPRASSLKALTTFTGLAHRFQLVLDHNGVRWINDSKATNVGSTEAALNGLQLDGTLYLLLGGDGKSADFTPLKRYLGGDRIRLYCFGRDGAELAELRPDVAVQTETMEQAMRQIASLVKAGDMVLLSPACASLDQFKNFEQRGDMFARLAKELG